jgi:hypothetical protein
MLHQEKYGNPGVRARLGGLDQDVSKVKKVRKIK